MPRCPRTGPLSASPGFSECSVPFLYLSGWSLLFMPNLAPHFRLAIQTSSKPFYRGRGRRCKVKPERRHRHGLVLLQDVHVRIPVELGQPRSPEPEVWPTPRILPLDDVVLVLASL